MKIFGFNFFHNDAEQFNNLMEIAKNVAEQNPSALHDFVRAIIRPLQSERILSVAERDKHRAPPPIDGYSFFFSNMEVFSGSKYLLRNSPKIELNLARDPIVPTPWFRSRFVDAIANIGNGKPSGSWRQDQNHVVSLWLPWGIGFVSGGNHSIAAGILSGEDISIVVTETFDFSPIFEFVECDGLVYRNKLSGEVLSCVTDQRRAAIFEIGRLMSITIPSHQEKEKEGKNGKKKERTEQ